MNTSKVTMKLHLTAILVGLFNSLSFGQREISNFTNGPVASILHCDTSLLNKYKAALVEDTFSHDRKFIKKLLGVIHKFDGKQLDTTITSLENVDGTGHRCKLISRIYLYGDAVFVDSWITRKHDTLWNNRLKNPYIYVGSHYSGLNLFDWKKRSAWVIFTVGIFYGSPTFVRFPKFYIDASKMILGEGNEDLKNRGILISSDRWESYLKNFKGNLLTYGDPEARESFFIWYEPCKCFITYYAP